MKVQTLNKEKFIAKPSFVISNLYHEINEDQPLENSKKSNNFSCFQVN